MRASWTGVISFGLVSVPITLTAATEEHKVPLHQIHLPDGGQIRYRRVCEVDEKEVPYEEIGRSYEDEDDRVAVLTSEDLAELPVPTKKTVSVLAFVRQDEIDPVYYGRPYYVAPDKNGARAYALLRDVMADSDRVAVTKITLSSRESPAVLRVHDGLIVLHLMSWPDEVRQVLAPASPQDEVRPQEMAMAKTLVDQLSASFDEVSGDLVDDYQIALHDLVEARLEGAEPPQAAPAPRAASNVIDLMEVLSRSVEEAKTSRGGGTGRGARGSLRPVAEPDEEAADEPAAKPTKKTTAQKPPAQKPTAQKSTKTATARKSSGAKTASTKKTAKTPSRRRSA